jgi:dTDP-glucose 4,6-dehydratase
MHTQLNWKPLHKHEQGIRDTIDWYVANRAWWEPLLKQ